MLFYSTRQNRVNRAGFTSAGITAQMRLRLQISGSSSEINRIDALGGRQMTSFHRGPKYLKMWGPRRQLLFRG